MLMQVDSELASVQSSPTPASPLVSSGYTFANAKRLLFTIESLMRHGTPAEVAGCLLYTNMFGHRDPKILGPWTGTAGMKVFKRHLAADSKLTPQVLLLHPCYAFAFAIPMLDFLQTLNSAGRHKLIKGVRLLVEAVKKHVESPEVSTPPPLPGPSPFAESGAWKNVADYLEEWLDA
jgi:hypothetical protein